MHYWQLFAQITLAYCAAGHAQSKVTQYSTTQKSEIRMISACSLPADLEPWCVSERVFFRICYDQVCTVLSSFLCS
ncbi:hypothetical protein J3A83DRAFT_4217288 [Scleroderma citrinum]